MARARLTQDVHADLRQRIAYLTRHAVARRLWAAVTDTFPLVPTAKTAFEAYAGRV